MTNEWREYRPHHHDAHDDRYRRARELLDVQGLRSLIAEHAGVSTNSTSGNVPCPFHDDSDPSLSVYDAGGVTRFRCWGECGDAVSGTLIDWYKLHQGCDEATAVGLIEKDFNLAPLDSEMVAALSPPTTPSGASPGGSETKDWVSEIYLDPLDVEEITAEPLLARSDGEIIIPTGMASLIFGPPGIGKSFVALATVKNALAKGGRVFYFETDNVRRLFRRRARLMGITSEVGDRERFVYSRHEPFDILKGRDAGEAMSAWQDWLAEAPNPTFNLVVIDMMRTSGCPLGGQDGDVEEWFSQNVRVWEHDDPKRHPAVLLIDHSPKEIPPGGPPTPLGSTMKSGAVSGVCLFLRGKKWTPGNRGAITLKVTKDREGVTWPNEHDIVAVAHAETIGHGAEDWDEGTETHLSFTFNVPSETEAGEPAEARRGASEPAKSHGEVVRDAALEIVAGLKRREKPYVGIREVVEHLPLGPRGAALTQAVAWGGEVGCLQVVECEDTNGRPYTWISRPEWGLEPPGLEV